MSNQTSPVCRYTVEYKYLKALALFASKDPCRYVLCGVAIEGRGTSAFIVGTDGWRIGIISTQLCEGDTGSEEVLIIPTDLIKRLPKPRLYNVTVECDGDMITITSDDSKVSGKSIKGTFPNWRGAVDETEFTTPKRVRFNPEVMSAYFNAAKIINRGGGVVIECGKPKGETEKDSGTPFFIRIPLAPEFFGMMMPVRPASNEGESIYPAWLRATVDAGKEVA